MRLEITQRADLAIRALALLACTPARLKSADLAAAVGSTPGFIPQVMGPLVRAGWVRSEPGPAGGYEAAVALDHLSLLDVIEQVDGPTETGRCVVGGGPCDGRKPCALHAAWGKARHELTGVLAATTMAEVAG